MRQAIIYQVLQEETAMSELDDLFEELKQRTTSQQQALCHQRSVDAVLPPKKLSISLSRLSVSSI